MPQMIASTYEIKQKLGSGGMGVVYLGEHTRLGKPVVLKADKRTLSTKPEVLRREVDALKNLSHTYIPQVYDFIAEGDTVYTVMDFIEGESLDKPLGRGERFSQPQVIEWACQLLEALCYLHSRPPHGILHSDIKPANIMVTPQGDIRLIDFNIALALGEKGTVQVGYSLGYASPEHYGMDYSSVPSRGEKDEDATELVTNAPTLLVPKPGVEKRKILLDVRSDVYSLGATLYHLLSGQRPPQDAKDVQPLFVPGISHEVAAIIQKAMAPDPNQRYQTAQEMLDAFLHLHDNDPRTLRHKKRTSVLLGVFIALFLAGGLCTFTGLKQTQEAEAAARHEAEEAEEKERTAKNALAAVTASEAAYANGDVPEAVEKALEAMKLEGSPYGAQAQKALTDALGVYQLSGGFRPHLLPALPREPVKLALSPHGTRAAAMTVGEALVFDTESGIELARLTAEPSALSDVVFADENVVIYAGEDSLRAYNLAQGWEMWSSGNPATTIALSADGSVVAAVYKDNPQAFVYNASTGELLHTVDFGGLGLSVTANDVFLDPEDDLFALNASGTLLAVGFSNGGLTIFDLSAAPDNLILYESSDFTHFQGGFYGRFFAWSAYAAATEENIFGVVDTAAKEVIGGFAGDSMLYHASADESGIYVSLDDVLVRLDPETGEQTELAYTSGAEITSYALSGGYTIVQTADGAVSVFDSQANLRDTWEAQSGFVSIAGDFAAFASVSAPEMHILKLDNRDDAFLGTYDPSDAHDEARISADGKTLMLFSYDGFRIYDVGGELLTSVSLPDPLQVYDQQFRRENGQSWLEVTYNSGVTRNYSAADGSLISEEQREKPDESIQEEFLTDTLRIERPLHGTPMAYDRESGELRFNLEDNDYLAYVVQAGEYIVTDYISGQGGERYSLLLNEDGGVLARMPQLCDVLEDGTLVFDDHFGNLRFSRIYSPQELLALGEQYQGGNT